LGFTGVSVVSAEIARTLFYIFLVIFLVLASDKSNIDESDPQICPLLAPKLSHRLDNRDLKRRSNVAAKEVTSPHAAVAQSEHSVEMQAGLAVVSLRDVAEQTQYLALLVDGDWIVSLGGEIEPPDLGAFERSDRRDRCPLDGVLIRKSRDRRESFFTLIQDQDEYPAVIFRSQFGSHEQSR
jgi:hypothetical protein